MDRNDLRLLSKVREAGWWFDDGRSSRPSGLATLGLLKGELRVWKTGKGGRDVEFRMAYQLTSAGQSALAKVSP